MLLCVCCCALYVVFGARRSREFVSLRGVMIIMNRRSAKRLSDTLRPQLVRQLNETFLKMSLSHFHTLP